MVLIKLDENINYIVSGLERSGTSMLMQILNAGDIPVAFDNSRQADEFNPKGYYELEGGKIINKLINRCFPIEKYKGKFIKITSYGLKYLPNGTYKIIYSERDFEEILDSIEKMMKKKDEARTETRRNLIKLNNMIKKHILEKKEIKVLFVNYNKILIEPKNNIKKILDFLSVPYENIDKMMAAVDIKLYQERK